MTTKQLAEYLTAQLGGTFRITDDVQLYNNKWLQRCGVDFTPGIVRRLLDAPPVYNYGTYATVYRLEMQGDRNKRREIEQDISDFIASKHSQAESIGDYKFIGAYRHPIPSDFEPKGDGSGGDVFKITVDFELWVILSGVTGSETRLFIDGEEVPFVEIIHEDSKALVPNLPYWDDTELKEFTGNSLSVSLPIVDNEKIKQLLAEVKSNKSNLKHTIKHTIADWYVIEGEYVLKSGVMRAAKNTDGLSIALSFINAFPRKEIKLRLLGDAEYKTIPLLAYNYSLSATHNTTVKDGYNSVFGELKNYPLQTGYSIEATFAFSEVKDKLPLLYQYIKENNSNAIYEVLDGGYEYKVIIKSATEAYEETPDIALRVVFVEADLD